MKYQGKVKHYDKIPNRWEQSGLMDKYMGQVIEVQSYEQVTPLSILMLKDNDYPNRYSWTFKVEDFEWLVPITESPSTIDIPLGARVKLIYAMPDDLPIYAGSTGTLLAKGDKFNSYGVEWDNLYTGHSLLGYPLIRPCADKKVGMF